MILLHTHVWVWWIQGDPRVGSCIARLDSARSGSVLVSAISCWEIAVLHTRRRLMLGRPLPEWVAAAIHDAAVCVVDVTPQVALESEMLPGDFHRDPADRMLVASARLLDCSLLTEDRRIREYPHVRAMTCRNTRHARNNAPVTDVRGPDRT